MSQPLREFSPPFQRYAVAEIAAGCFAAAWAVSYSHPTVAIGLAVIFSSAALVRPVASPFGGIRDPHSALVIVAALIWQPEDVMLGVGVGSFVGLLLFRKNEFWRAATNSAGWGLGAAATASLAHATISVMPTGIAAFAVAAIISVVSYRTINTGIFAAFRSLRFDRPFLREWSQNLRFQWASPLLSAPLAIVVAALASRTGSVWYGLALTSVTTLALPVIRQEYAYANRSREMLDETVEAVLKTLEGAHPEARAHGDRVSRLAMETGKQLGMSERELLALRLAGRLHDVGILAETDEESREAHHAAVGGRILAQFPEPLIGRFVRAHHEHWDGSGVPDHLHGEAIPLGARILATAEVYDSTRSGLDPFGVPATPAEAAHSLTTLAGSTLDPKVVATLLSVVEGVDGSRDPA